LQLLEAEEGAGDLAVESDFVAQEEFVGADTFWGTVQSQDGPQGRRVGCGGGRGHIVVEGDFLHSPDSILTPAGGGDGLDHHGLGGSAGLVFVHEFLD
jgi:hypothetical protein